MWWGRWQELEAAGHFDSTVRRQDRWKLVLAPVLLLIQSRTPARGMAPPMFRVSLPTSLGLI